MEYNFTHENFEKEVLQSDIPVMVDFFATWCGPCKMMAPFVEQLAETFEGKIKIGKLDIDENIEVAQQYRVMSVPTFLIFKNGQVVDKIIGAVNKTELEAALQKTL